MGFIQQKRSNLERNLAINEIITFIHENYGRSDLSLNVLAGEFKLSIYYLSRIFKEKTGENFIDFITALRVDKAKELLLQNDAKIRDIADAVGYSNSNSFVRIFKKSTGLTPTEFREKNKGQ